MKLTYKFTYEEMKSYLKEFDVLENKYFYWRENIQGKAPEPGSAELKERIFSEWHMDGRRGKWNVDNAIDTFQTLQKVYGENDRVDCSLVQCAVEKFLRDYVSIPGTDKLFDSKYFSFEWGMHLEYKEKQKDYSYYRDHYVHQIRNLYEMLIFLKEFQLDRRCLELYGRSKNNMGNQIRDSIHMEMRCQTQADNELFGEIWKAYAEYTQNSGEERHFCNQSELTRDIYFRDIIYSASILASLIHDIGYPITYMARIADELQDFLPITRDFIENKMNITRLHSELEQSVLFNTIPYEMIEKKLLKNDHGAVSATIFLKYYYNKGLIRELPPTKKMIIELAAVMIFNHTLKYEALGDKEWNFTRPIFYKEPLSCLFRICDDIQEWDREYFEVSRQRNYFMCGKCKTMFHYDSKKKIYTCCCRQNTGENITGFTYRRIIQIQTSDSVTINRKPDTDRLDITISYDLFRLLLVSHYNPTFAKIRAVELRKIKILLSNQRFFPVTRVNCVVSSNPVLLKEKILHNFLANYFQPEAESIKNKLLKQEKTECDAGHWKDIWENLKLRLLNIDKDITNLHRALTGKVEKGSLSKPFGFAAKKSKAGKVSRELIICKLEFYIRLYFISVMLNRYKQCIGGDVLKVRWIAGKAFHDRMLLGKWKGKDDTLQYLCEDYIWQSMHETSEADFEETLYSEDYLNEYIQSDFLVDEVRSYTNYERYGRFQEKYRMGMYKIESAPVDFYTDLFMFYQMNKLNEENVQSLINNDIL